MVEVLISKETKMDATLKMDILTEYGMVHADEPQVHDIAFIFDLEFRNAVLSRGMYHKES